MYEILWERKEIVCIKQEAHVASLPESPSMKIRRRMVKYRQPQEARITFGASEFATVQKEMV